MKHTGPPPKPTHLKLLAGNPGHRPLNKREAQPKIEIPTCPAHLSTEARKEWKRVAKQLRKLGLLSKIDRAALAAYCQAWGRWIEAEDNLKQHGTIINAKYGYPIMSPWLSVANGALQHMRAYMTEFGLTPASRSRIEAAPVEGDDEEARRERRFFGDNG